MGVVRTCGNEPSAIFDPAMHDQYEHCIEQSHIDEIYQAKCAPLAAVNATAFEACVQGRSSPDKFMQQAQTIAATAQQQNTQPQKPQDNTVMYVALIVIVGIVVFYLLKDKKE